MSRRWIITRPEPVEQVAIGSSSGSAYDALPAQHEVEADGEREQPAADGGQLGW
jgi:hypothetical protein